MIGNVTLAKRFLRTLMYVMVLSTTTLHGSQNVLGQDSMSWVPTGLEERNIVGLVSSGDGHLFAAAAEAGVFRSGDGGDTWVKTWEVADSDRITSLAMGRDGLLLAGTRNTGVYSSADGGENWVEVLAEGVTHLQFYIARHREHVVALSEGVRVSTDGGQLWESPPVFAETSYVFTSFSSDTSGTLFLGSTGPVIEPAFGNIYRLTDWYGPLTRIGSMGTYRSILAVGDGSVFAGGSFGVGYTPNTEPAKWEQTLFSATEDLLRVTRDTLYAATLTGVYLTEN